MKLLYGTGNLAKLSAMRNRLEQLDIELIGLNDLRVEGKNVPEVKEDGNTPLENARLKAMAYYEAFQIPVFSCDSGLYFDNVPNEVQPGVHVRNVNGKCLSDDEMIDYYSGLVKAYGNLVARYRNAICFVMDNTHIYEARVYLQKHKKVSEYDSENLMYSLIEDIISANKYSSLDVVCHFPLNMLIKNPELLNEQECQYAMNPATHLDFLIYNRIGKKPVLAIEVDGYEYHKEDTVQASRDLLKNHIMELYEIPLLRFMTNGSGEKEKIIEMLDKLVG